MPRMYSLSEVAKIKDVYENFRHVEEELLVFCDSVAKLMSWDSVETVNFIGDEIEFTTSCYGAYQSIHQETFHFPSKLLVHGVNHVYEYIKSKLLDAERKLKEKQKSEKEEAERKQYLVLKQKFEKTNG